MLKSALSLSAIAIGSGMRLMLPGLSPMNCMNGWRLPVIAGLILGMLLADLPHSTRRQVHKTIHTIGMVFNHTPNLVLRQRYIPRR